ncbi:hypothetical protein PPERSA_05752 [Pseudocohnilembus persalinus]|uniref:Bromodomain associated domain-containing protein n=1 Tax=Pseudocohnilembus persalinus TaxID=266149 RepID=A0A0V0QI25_PSEPJ|nr:hypothetical protein PPERSA_05752 [Pseudocohnilembus persalinus]|eukprot:KRX01913.1 hypothetical protein PPERSA_05752 [Pseudocohnilembus persalinus]
MQSNSSNLGYPETVHKLMKIYIVQYLIKHNYQKVHENGLNILADLLIKYIQKLGQKTKQIAEKSKRNIPNMLQLFMVMDQTNVNLMRLNDFILDEEHGTADDGFMQSVCKEVFPEHEIEQFRKNQLSKQDLEGLQMSFIDKQNQEPIILMPTLDQMIQPPDQNSLKKTNMQQKQYLNEIEIKNLKIKQKEYFQNQQQEIIQKKQELIEQELENQKKVNQALGIGGEFNEDTENNSQAEDTIKNESSVHLTKIPLGLTILYSIIFFFILLGILACFRHVSPEGFGKLGCCMSCLGIWVRNFKTVILLINLIVFILLFAQFCTLFFTNDCKNSPHITTQTVDDRIVVQQTLLQTKEEQFNKEINNLTRRISKLEEEKNKVEAKINERLKREQEQEQQQDQQTKKKKDEKKGKASKKGKDQPPEDEDEKQKYDLEQQINEFKEFQEKYKEKINKIKESVKRYFGYLEDQDLIIELLDKGGERKFVKTKQDLVANEFLADQNTYVLALVKPAQTEDAEDEIMVCDLDGGSIRTCEEDKTAPPDEPLVVLAKDDKKKKKPGKK